MELASNGGAGMEEVSDFLQECRLGHLLPHLEQLGVGCLHDLVDVNEENLEGAAITVVERNRFLRLVNERRHTPSLSSTSFSLVSSSDERPLLPITSSVIHDHDTDVPSVGAGIAVDNAKSCQFKKMTPSTVTSLLIPLKSATPASTDMSHASPVAPSTTHMASAVTMHLIQVRYLLCSRLFLSEVCEKVVFNLDPATTTMKELYGLIQRTEHVEEGFSLELYSHEGYPLNSNDYTCHCTLKQWRVTNNDLFYVFIRREDQPESPSPQTELSCDHDHNDGKDELTIESSLFGSFTIRADVDRDKAEDIHRKVANYTKIPRSHIHLFARQGYTLLHEDMYVRNGDILTLVLNKPSYYLDALGTEYGKKTYNPVVPQSDKGLSKFFSILKFICSTEQEVEGIHVSHLLVFLQQLTHCPPIVHALKLLYENSFLSLPCWVALVEGCYQLFSSFLAEFCNVENMEVFEYSDYFWAYFINKSEIIPPTSSFEYEKLSLVCPLSGIKISQPVTIPGCDEFFDRRSIIEKMEAGVTIPGCSKFPLTTDDMKESAMESRMILYHPWESEKEIYVLKGTVPVPCIGKVLPLVGLPCSWNELPMHIASLRIHAPDGLFTGKECLTFITNGQLVYFMGFCKDRDSGRKVFNPVECDYEYHSKIEMAEIGQLHRTNETSDVVCDLTVVLKSEIKSRSSQSVLSRARPELILAEKAEEKVDWKPDEAIVVLLDCSRSMHSTIFPESCSDDIWSSKLNAARDLFDAFANRSQAYNFHHSMGLTVFNRKVEVVQPLTKIYEYFRESLQRVAGNPGTALNDAMMSAVRQLKDYTKIYPDCRRRILCLTDGMDSYSWTSASKVAQNLQDEQVVVDTILIGDCPGNIVQKSITHASGGACFLPTSSTAFLKLFEMETLLSVRARVLPKNLPPARHSVFLPQKFQGLVAYKDLTKYPYNSGQLPSNFVAQVQETKTASAERVLHTASLAMRLEDVHLSASSCNPNPYNRRILREINEFRRNPHTDIEIFPSADNIRLWKILLKGPESTPYENGVFVLCAIFSSFYPAKPPEVRFLTPIYHCNINSSGRICHRVFGSSYTPSVTMREILSCVCGLLMSPEPDDPLDSVLAGEFHNNVTNYMEVARQFTQRYAKEQTFVKLKKDLSGEGDACAGASSNLKCPLTTKLFEDPVQAPSGHTYERKAIIEHLRLHGEKDPLTSQPLRRDQLTPNRVVKGLVEQFKRGATTVNF